MKSAKRLILGATVVAFSTHASLANSCSQDIHRAWGQINAKSRQGLLPDGPRPKARWPYSTINRRRVRSPRPSKRLLTSGCRSRWLWRPSLMLVKRIAPKIGSHARGLLQRCSAWWATNGGSVRLARIARAMPASWRGSLALHLVFLPTALHEPDLTAD
jgi:hypothetical protein